MSLPLLRCATLKDGKRILNDIYEGECGLHIGVQSIATNALRTRYH